MKAKNFAYNKNFVSNSLSQLKGKDILPLDERAKKEIEKRERLAKLVKTSQKALKVTYKWTAITLALGFVAFLMANALEVWQANTAPPVKNPHTTENVIDPNGNDFQYGENGQIELDQTTQEEKKILSKHLNQLILQDANSRFNGKIEDVKEIISLSLLPYNLREGKNEFDKYCLSVLFSDSSNTLYALNYMTGKDFESKAELSKDYVADFINFLSQECALSSCQKMGEEELALKNVIADAVLVGEAYRGYQPSGDKYYFIPVYKQNGDGTVYYALKSELDIMEETPMEKLHDELTNGAMDIFSSMPFTASENLQKVSKILKDELETTSSSQAQQDDLTK